MHLQRRLHSSKLVHLLQQWTQAPGRPMHQDVAEPLSQWLGTVDAVRLGRALHALESVQPAGPAPARQAEEEGGVQPAADLAAMLQAAQAELAELIQAGPVPPRPARQRADHTTADRPDPEVEADFAVHAARYLSLQKQMETRLGALRVQMRQLLSTGPVALRTLAMLDTVLEQMLAAREQKLWATLPGHLERRMAQLRAAHQQRLQQAVGGEDDDPQRWRQPGGWLAIFEQDQRSLLLAEMDVRLQPHAGLVEAARNRASAEPLRALNK